MALTFTENFRSIGLTEEAPDEFCGQGQGEGEGEGHGTEGGYIGRSGLKGLISNTLRRCVVEGPIFRDRGAAKCSDADTLEVDIRYEGSLRRMVKPSSRS